MSKNPRKKTDSHSTISTGKAQAFNQPSSLFPIGGAVSRMKGALYGTSLFDTATGMLPAIGNAFSAIPEMGSVLKAFSATTSVFKNLERHIASFRQAMDDHERELPVVLEVMVEHSWYPDFDFDLVNMRQLEEPAKVGDIAAMEVLLIQHFQQRRISLEKELIAEFPARERPLREAFEAYDGGKYLLAIPVFLAQADGISMSILESNNFFSFNHSEKAAKRRKNSEVGSYAQILLEPLVQRGTLRRGTNYLKNIAYDFNRHAIMHGIVNDYGTSVNALKAISLLAYLHSL